VTVVRPLILLPADPFGAKIGGIQTFVREFVRFSPDDFDIEGVGCTSDERSRPLHRWTRIDVDGRSIRYLPILRIADVHRRSRVPLSLRFTAAAMRRIRGRQTRGRVLQFHHPGVPAGFLTSRAPKVHVVHLNPAEIDRGGGESKWGIVPGVLHRFEDVTLPRMDRIFVVNRDGVDFYRRRHPSVAGRTSFLPTVVDPTRFAPLADGARAEARRRLLDRIGLVGDEPGPLVLFVGRLELQKDPMLLIRSIAAVQPKQPGVRLLVVGEGTLRGEAEQLATELGVAHRVHWMGFQAHEALPELMNAVDLLLLPSRFEGMPITVLEALACGLPVVASAVGEVPSLVRHERNGWLVHDREPASFAEAIAWVVGSARIALQREAVEAVRPFNPAIAWRGFYDAHRELHEERWGKR
jgi:glycosyltransferase involved in cell wall biosynthesis